MRKITPMVVLSVILGLLLSACGLPEGKNNTYTSKDGISFTYPSGWTILDSKLPSFPVTLSKDEEVTYGDLNCTINLNITNHTGENLNFTTIVENYKNALLMNKMAIIEEEFTKINGSDAYRVVHYMAADYGKNIKLLKYIQFSDETNYTTTFICPEKKFDTYKSEAIEIMNSFRYN